MLRSRVRQIACCLLFCLLVAGCNGGRETDEIAWVLSIGVDKAGDELEITYRIAIPSALSGTTGGGGDKKESTSVITVKAPNLAEGRNLLNTVLSRAVSLSQVRVFVISEELARAGVDDLIGPIVRFREFRGSTFIIVNKGRTRDIFEKNKPVLETLTSRWIENFIQSSNEAGYYPRANLHDFYLRMKNETGAPYTMYYALNPLTGQGKISGSKMGGERANQYLPGNIPREGGDSTEVLGTAVFKAAKLVGTLDSEETRALLILQNRFERSFVVVEDPLAPKHTVNVALRNGRKPKIEVHTDGENPMITVDVFLEGEISSIPSGIAYEASEYRSLLEAQISNVIKQQIELMLEKTQKLSVDVVDFGYYARANFTTMEQMKAYQWDERYPHAQINVIVNNEIRRTGLMQKSNPIRRE